MEAFGELSTCRAVGMDLGAIPWTAIVQYADRQRVDREEDFLYIMRAMDCAYLKFVKTQREKK